MLLNPIRFIDPDGRAPFTDYTFNKSTGEVKQVGETNDEPDRIVKSDEEGNAVLNKKGNVKVEVDNIAKGILKDGQNFKSSDNIVDVEGKGKPTLSQVEGFLVKISNYIGKEVGGGYLSKDSNENGNISKVYIDKYKNNTYTSSVYSLYRYNIGDPSLKGYFKNTKFHVHPTGGFNRDTIENPSPADSDFKDAHRDEFHKFIIISTGKYGGVETYPY